MRKQMKKKLYKSNWFIILMLILFFPLGLVLMWAFADWRKLIKWIVTATIVLLGIISITIETPQDTSTINNNDSDTVAEKTEEKKEKTKKKKQNKKESNLSKIEKELDKEVNMGKIQYVNYSDEEKIAIIDIKANDTFSEKGVDSNARNATAEALYALNKSKVDVQSADININFPTSDGLEEKESTILSTTWSGDVISKMNKDNVNTLPDNLKQHADHYYSLSENN